jgi:hypothetical protein
MQTAKLGHQFDLYWRKIVLFILLFSGYFSQAQINKRYNLSTYDDQKIHFGYLLGLNYSNFKVVLNDKFLAQDSIRAIFPTGKTGFEVGFIFNLRLADYFDLRALPKVSFYERQITYAFKSPQPKLIADFQASVIELPILLKYKSERRGNTRLYMVGGIKTSFEVGAKKRQKRNNLIATDVFSLTAEYGIGLDNYFELFKLAPELRFSMGLLNAFKKQDNYLSQPIKSIKPYNLSLCIMFE